MSTATDRAARLAGIGLLANVLLALIKLVAGLVGHSAALMADAVESMTDTVGSIVIWGGLRYGARPADENHPFGHQRAESLAALAVGALVVAAGIIVATHAVDEILDPQETPAAWTLLVLVMVIVTKETLFRVARRLGHQLESTVVATDAWHHRSDAITSAAAFVGISLAVLGGPAWSAADGWAALIAAVVILFNGWLLVRAPFRELMDEQPEGLPEEVERVALGVPGVRSVEKTYLRHQGSRFIGEMHVRVDPELTVREGHAIAGRARAAIRAALPRVQDVLIHLEPEDDGPGEEDDLTQEAPTRPEAP